jgi:hypothetical protein
MLEENLYYGFPFENPGYTVAHEDMPGFFNRDFF